MIDAISLEILKDIAGKGPDSQRGSGTAGGSGAFGGFGANP